MRHLLLAGVLVLSPGLVALSQGLRVVQPLAGYTCMMLSAPPTDSIDQIPRIPARSAPSPSAPIIGYSPSVVLVQAPVRPTSGFLPGVLGDHRAVWIAASDLKPWSTPYNPSQRCYPSIMSNGSYGFDFH